MSPTFLKASLALWRRRADFHRTRWIKVHKTKDIVARKQQWKEWHDALAMVEKRTEQIAAALPDYLSGVSAQLPVSLGKWEGGRGSDGLFHPYWDSDGGVWTIGFGHTNADKGLVVTAHTKPLSLAEAQALLRHDLNVTYAPAVTRALKSYGWKGVGQKPYDGFVDFAYNLGPGYFGRGHSVGDAMALHSILLCAKAVLLYDKAGGRTRPGLTKRRRWEAQLIQGGTYEVNN